MTTPAVPRAAGLLVQDRGVGGGALRRWHRGRSLLVGVTVLSGLYATGGRKVPRPPSLGH